MVPFHPQRTSPGNIMDSVDALKVYATVEKAALKFRWKGQRGPPAPTGLSAAAAEEDEVALQARRRAFLLRDERQEQQKAILLERRKHAAAHVRKALKEKAKEFVISRPLRRFGMKLAVRLVHHAYDAKTKCETVSNRMVVMEDSVKFEALDGWVRTCLGSDKSSAKLKYQYVTLNGHPTVLDTKTALQNWLDEMWAVHPPTLHAFDDEGLLLESQDQTARIRDVFAE